ncbi:hypothetical protein BGI41_00690 [Methanobrevibacter sp. 87.7]|uniref:YcaO-related McrA-glycine thioamidation protein n=1 Tax=Methanobrevibacter sp. 87.7 TaxID=387957 RepID=UPI000B507E08|nr:YcaO-related McrA-glycine thioamidation protein [Methanobrevibacter sp. 87.7]OWT33751.1 hypothetical protein BGI41_00690 [Methanobrevibacter sp. 87.7]
MFSDIELKYFEGGHRICQPSETIKHNEDKLKTAGITRITNITDLDRIGIPVFSAIRPSAQGGSVSVYAGKGAKDEQAEASAIMEGFERYSAEMKEEDYDKLLVSSIKDMTEKYIDPRTLYLPKDIDNDKLNNIKLEWYPAIDIISEEEYYVPANAIFHPYIPHNKETKAIFKGNTNGLASGNIIEEAVLHGIFEVIERDAWSIFELTHKNGKEIDIDTITNPIILELLEKFNSESINIKLIDITNDIGVPTVTVSSDDNILKDPALLCLGVGTHLDPNIAIIRALTEVAQSRATQIHGTREDTTRANFMRKAGYERMKRINHQYFEEDDEKISIKDMNHLGTTSIKKDIEQCKTHLQDVGFDKILYTDLTRPEIGVSASRVIIPGAEVYTIDPDRLGKRYLKFVRKLNKN